MLTTIVLPCLAVLALSWSAINLWRKDTAVATGAAVMALVTGAAWAANELRVDAWLEGGFGMSVLAIVGAYALGAATAHRRSNGRGAFIASVVAASFMVILSGVFFWDAAVVLETLVRGATPEVKELIQNASRAETMRLLQLAAAVLLATGLTLMLPPRAGSSQAFVPALDRTTAPTR